MKADLEQDLLKSAWINDKCLHSPTYSQNLYAALCNNRFFKGSDEWTCSWRYAGGLVSQITRGGDYLDYDYMDYYCSGICDDAGFVSEGHVTEEISLDLMRIGWTHKPYEK